MPRLDRIAVISACLLLAGCATTLSSDNHTVSEARKPSDLAECDTDGKAEQQLDNRKIVGLLDEERFHAALARLDAMPQTNAYTRYLRAHVLRQLGREAEAESLYKELLTSCMEGYARHGLGLLAARDGEIDNAREYLGQAREQIPLDIRVRNDYGYVLLLVGQPEAAHAEFMTALELNGDVRQPRYNALLALMMLGRTEQAQRFAEHTKLSQADIDRARQEARRISQKNGSQPARHDGRAREIPDNPDEALLLKMDTRADDIGGGDR